LPILHKLNERVSSFHDLLKCFLLPLPEFYWPTFFLQVGEKVRGYVPCQMFAGKKKLAAPPLVPLIVSDPFLPSGLDFVGEIHPTSSN